MLGAQFIASFAVWMAVGWLCRKPSGRLIAYLECQPRPRRGMIGLVGLGASLLWLFAGIGGVASGHGLTQGSLALWAWLAVTLVGAGFVALQAASACAFATLALAGGTPSGNSTSEHQNP